MKRSGVISGRGGQALTVAFGGAPGIKVPHKEYYGRRRENDRVVSAGGVTWSQQLGPGSGSCSRAVVVRSNNQVQVGDAPPFVVIGGVGLPNRPGHVATYQNGGLVNRGSVLVPPNKFLATNGIDSASFISLSTAALGSLSVTLVVVPGAGTAYYTEDGIQHTVPMNALSDIVLVPAGVPVVKMATPVPTLGRVVLPLNAKSQKLVGSILSLNYYELAGFIIAIGDGFFGVFEQN